MKSILENIKGTIENLNWSSETKKQKAIDLCISIYNLYVYDGGDFYHYKRLSKEYFNKIIKTKSYVYEIKNNLIDNSILEPHYSNSYDVEKGKGKGYRFNPNLINGNYVALNGPKNNDQKERTLNDPKSFIENISSLKFQVNNSFISLINNLELHICGPKTQECIQSGFSRLKFKPEVNDFINNFKLNREDIKVNNEIDLDYIDLKLENDIWRVSLEKAFELSKEADKDLILYKEKAYIENEDDFTMRKERELKLIFNKNVFEVENNIFRISRNETNRRLDYNLTNMKSDLLDYLEIDGETLIELDIANAQFVILSYLVKDLDNDFIMKSKSGKLYNNNKKDWFRVAFDKVKKEQDNIREIYPETMKFIDSYKNKWGYKSFSNLLQNVESMIMIDGLLPKLLNYDVFPIHDAIRVKQSEVEEVKVIIEEYFKEIGFNCFLRNKIKKETEIINYKGIREVEIEKVTREDKKLFISKINALKDIGIEPSEAIMISLNLFSEEKSSYMYHKWRKVNKYPEIEKNDF
jgi:hypothetical protein